MKLVIFGSRDAYPTFKDIDSAVAELKDKLQTGGYMGSVAITEVVSGKCPRGADACGEDWARQNGLPIKPFPADWNKHGKPAGFIRNREMAEYADVGVGFWKKESGGTANMATHLLVRGKEVVVRGA